MNGIWNAESAKHHQSSLKFAKWLAGYLPKDTIVMDLGCGNGYYMAYLESVGFDAIGVDGNSDIEILCEDFMPTDLSKPIYYHRIYNVISLEVGEHLPKEAQETFTNNLVSGCKKHLILSWASIGQPGIGHINCREQSEVIADIEGRGFKLNKEATAEARQNVDDNCDWLQRNLLVFERV
jgi:SAM-dependent methyltransferase